MTPLFVFALFFAGLSVGYSDRCLNPEISSETFTTQDATIVTNIAYICEFQVRCKSGVAANLYAEIDGSIVPISVIGPNTHQISWTEDTKVATRGDKIIRLFDEDGIASIRKALREGEDVSTVPALLNLVINYPGAFNGPWLKSEFLAAFLSLVIAYVAISSKSKLVS